MLQQELLHGFRLTSGGFTDEEIRDVLGQR
jgi:hypothetical protein